MTTHSHASVAASHPLGNSTARRSDISVGPSIHPPGGEGFSQDAELPNSPVEEAFEKRIEEGQSKAVEPELDIEHLLVHDDPRKWPRRRKMAILWTIAFTAMGGTISASVYFPAIASLQKDLKASDGLVSLSVSLFILGQGVFPSLWSGISEIKGRKLCYILALLLYCAATAVCSRATTIGLFIGFRVVQSLGSSAVLALGGGTLSDIFDTEERGEMLGLYYGLPLLGPALGPLIYVDVSSHHLRNVQLTIDILFLQYGGVCLALSVWLPETFRKERSLAWRKAMKQARAHAKAEREKARRQLPAEEAPPPPSANRIAKTAFGTSETVPRPGPAAEPQMAGMPALGKVVTAFSLRSGEDEVKIHLRDVNPFAAVGDVLAQRYNFLVILYSGFLFGSQYTVTFSTSRTFAAAPYNYSALKVGLVLLSFGCGNVLGSVLGGRYSDYVFLKLKAKNGGVGEPEMRVRSTIIALGAMPPLLVAFAWVVQERTPVYWPIIVLFLLGFATIWIYSSALAYCVDANPGRASTAVATNSLSRGVIAAVASQVCQPAIDKIGDGWWYTGFAVVLTVGELGFLLVGARGRKWRDAYLQSEALKKLEPKEDTAPPVVTHSRLPWRGSQK